MAEKKTSPESAASSQSTAGEQTLKKLTKKEAVRLALEDLGNDATPTEIQGHIKKHYGIEEMGLGHISTTKGELRRAAAEKAEKQAAAAAAEAAPEEDTLEEDAPEEANPEPASASVPAQAAASPEPTQATGKITGVEAVRLVLPTLGKDPTHVAIQQAVKERYDLDLKLDYVAKLKGKIMKEKKKKPSKKPASKPAEKEEGTPQPQEQPATEQAAPAAGNGKEELWSDILTLREILKRVGPDKVRTLISMLTGQQG